MGRNKRNKRATAEALTAVERIIRPGLVRGATAHESEDFFGIPPTRTTVRKYTPFPPRPRLLTSYGERHLSEILPGQLWQSGSIEEERLLRDAGIDYVINLTPDPPVRFGRFGYPFVEVRYPIGDGALANVDLDHIGAIVDGAVRHILNGGKVLSHCQMGWNRSGLVSGLIMLGLGFEGDVVDHIRRQRSPHALCNEQFADHLRSLQSHVQYSKSVV